MVSRAIVRDARHGPDLAAALGLLATIMSVSPVVGPILGALVVESVGWRGLFGILSLLGLLAAMSVYAGIAGNADGADKRRRGDDRAPDAPAAGAPELFGVACCSARPFYFAFGAIYTNAPFVLIDHFGLSHREFGGAFAVLSAFLAGGGLLGPRS